MFNAPLPIAMLYTPPLFWEPLINTPLIILGSPVIIFLPIPIPPQTCRAPVEVDDAGVEVFTYNVVLVIT